MALAALVLGVMGAIGGLFILGAVPGLVAVVLGVLGLRQTRDPHVEGRGFAIAGLVLGAVGVVVGLLVLAALIPATQAARASARQVVCMSNLRQVGLVAFMYAQDDPENARPHDFDALLQTGHLTPDLLICPAKTNAPPTASYVWAGRGLPETATGQTAMAFEPLANHDGTGGAVLFADGHVQFLPPGPRLTGLVNAAVAEGRLTTAEAEDILAVP